MNRHHRNTQTRSFDSSARHRIGNVVKFQIKKHLSTSVDNLADNRWSFCRKQLHPDLEHSRKVAKRSYQIHCFLARAHVENKANSVFHAFIFPMTSFREASPRLVMNFSSSSRMRTGARGS